MMRIRIRVTSPDLIGMACRTLIPTEHHVGMQGEVKKLDWIHIEDQTFQIIEAIMENGDVLTLVGHQFELVGASHDCEL